MLKTDGTPEGTAVFGPAGMAGPAVRIGRQLVGWRYQAETGLEFAAIDFETGAIISEKDIVRTLADDV